MYFSTCNTEVDSSNEKSTLRQMTLFQALTVLKYPKLVGSKFDLKVQEYERKWGKADYFIGDNRDFIEKFGVTLQIWTRIRNENNRAQETKLIFDSVKKAKLSVLIDNFGEFEPLHCQSPIFFVRDPVKLNFWSCANKFCFFGTNRYDRLVPHVQNCTDQTVIKYKQKKYGKDESEIAQELFREKILPTVDFQNYHFCSYDIGMALNQF